MNIFFERKMTAVNKGRSEGGMQSSNPHSYLTLPSPIKPPAPTQTTRKYPSRGLRIDPLVKTCPHCHYRIIVLSSLGPLPNNLQTFQLACFTQLSFAPYHNRVSFIPHCSHNSRPSQTWTKARKDPSNTSTATHQSSPSKEGGSITPQTQTHQPKP